MGVSPVASLRSLQIIWLFDIKYLYSIYFMTVEGHTLNFLYHSIFFIALTFGGTISEIVDLKTVISWILFFFFF